MIRNILEESKSNPQLINKNMLNMEINISAIDESRRIGETNGISSSNNQLHIFYDQKEEIQDAKPLGFGWGNQHKFGYGTFQFTTRVDEYSQEEERVIKNLGQDDLTVMNYVIKEHPERPAVVNPLQKPVSFVITQFHIIFIYR